MRILYIILPILFLGLIGFFIWSKTSSRPLSLSQSDIVITESLPNIVTASPRKTASAVTEELGYYKTDLNRPIEAYYPFAGTTAAPQLTMDELGLERVVISASLRGIDTNAYTLLHLPTTEEVVFDNGQVVEGAINYVESAVKDDNLYLSFYRGAIRDYENPESKIRQEMQRIKLVQNGKELKKVVLFEGVNVEIPQDQYVLVTLPSDLNTATLTLNKKVDTSFAAYLVSPTFSSKTPIFLLKLFPTLFGTKIESKISVNGDKQGWEIETISQNSKILLLPQ